MFKIFLLKELESNNLTDYQKKLSEQFKKKSINERLKY